MKTWLITGCSSGIGKGIAKAVLESGDQAIVTARNKDKVMDIVEAYPETALAVSLDVCSQDSIKNAVKEAYDKFGTIDVLVNNAGYGYRSAVEEGEIEAVQTLYQTNLFGPIELIKAVLPKMREQKSGYILNVTSIAAARSAVGSGYYASSKAALELLTTGLMKELAPLGIKAMVVQPGAFRTRFYDGESLQGTKAQIGDYEAVEAYVQKTDELIDNLNKTNKMLKDRLTTTEANLAVLEEKMKNISDNESVSMANLDLLKRISTLEQALFKAGINPSNIK